MKKLKVNLKVILALSIILMAMCIFNASTVNAVEMTEQEIQEIFDLIPDTMTLDIPEIEYEKASGIVKTNVLNILKNEGKQDVEITCDAYSLNSLEDFYKAYISIGDNYSNRKEIQLTYNNHSSYNANDEQIVKNLKIDSPKYYKVNLDFYDTDDYEMNNKFLKVEEEYFTNLINDKSIVVKAYIGASGMSGFFEFGTGERCTIGLFKNGILYDVRKINNAIGIPVINVPNTVADNEVNNYIISLITKHQKEFGQGITKIEKGITGYLKGTDIPNGYTVYSSYYGNSSYPSYFIVNREQPTNVEKEDTNTGIKVETNSTVLSNNIKLVTNKVTDKTMLDIVKKALTNIANKYTVFDINLLENNVKVQPNGKVKVSLPIPNDYNKSRLVVYRVEENGTKTKYDVKVEGNYATFETDHFSIYVLAESTEKDETPKTGTETNNLTYILPLSMSAVVGAVITTRKQRKE